jgi:hypothetical protein
MHRGFGVLVATVITLEGQPAGTYNDAAAFQIDVGQLQVPLLEETYHRGR